jgi:hypothetical protein
MDAVRKPPAAVFQPGRLTVQSQVRLTGSALADGSAYPAVILREGIYVPGIGNRDGKRILFRRAILAKLAETGEGKKVDLDHSKKEEDIVGAMTALTVDEASLRATLNLEAKRGRYDDAVKFIEGRAKGGGVANVSVELDNVVTQANKKGDKFQGQAWDEEVVDATLEGVAILPQGACSDKDGCGIGMSHAHFTGRNDAATITVLALQGIGQHKENPTMCDKHDEALQARVTALEADLTKEKNAHEETKKSLGQKDTELVSLREQVGKFEKQELDDLAEAVKALAPKGVELSALVGEKPTKATLTVALRSLEAAKPKGDEKTVAMGRASASGRQEQGTDKAAHQARVEAARKRFGLAEKSNLPASMQRNTERLLEAHAE